MPQYTQGTSSQPKRIAVLGMYGQLNLGNECTLQALLLNLRRICPEAEPFCICPEPGEVAARHGLAALQMSVGGRDADRGGALARLLAPLKPMRTRLRAFQWAYANLANTTMLVVAGTGIFEENICLSRGWLCDILTWCLAARLRRCYLAFVSIGAGPLHTFLARVIVKRALRMANYVSYRDRYSADYMASVGLSRKDQRIFPDLAFSLPPALLDCSPPSGKLHRRTVGVGIMDYFGQRKANRRTAEQYDAYLDALAVFVSRLVRNGCGVKLLGGDARYDPQVLVDFKERLAARRTSGAGGELSEARLDTVEGLIAEMSAVDAVVATRFHNLVLSLLLKRPTVSIAYHEKNDMLMGSFGLADFSVNVDELKEAELDKLVARVMQAWEDYELVVEQRLRECRQQLENQYWMLFGQLGGGGVPSGKV